jgi:hypothetical protein
MAWQPGANAVEPRYLSKRVWTLPASEEPIPGRFGKGTTSQALEKLNLEGLVTGHDFSRADKANQIDGALAPEGNFRGGSRLISTLSATCSPVP